MPVTRSNKDREALIRIDERTQALTENLNKFMTSFENHVISDGVQFESLKRWRSYIAGAVSVLGSLGVAASIYMAFVK